MLDHAHALRVPAAGYAIAVAAMGVLMTIVADRYRRSQTGATACRDVFLRKARERSDKRLHESETRDRMLVDHTRDAVSSWAVDRREVIRDITPRRLDEKAAQENAELLRAHLDNSPMAVVGWNGEFRVTRWAGEAERLFGWSAAEVIGKRIFDLHVIYEDDATLVEQTMAQILSGTSRYVVSSNRNVTRSGRVIHCVWHNSVITDAQGKTSSVLSQVEDVTENVHAETALRESEEKFRLLFEGMKLGIQLCELVFDANGVPVDVVIDDVNATYTQDIGIARENIVGRRLTDILPDVEPQWFARYATVVRTGEPIEFEEYSASLDRWLDVHVSAMGGNRIAAVFRDVTDRHKAEVELRAAKIAAERADSAKSRFLAATSHDLRQPLSALSLYVGALASKRTPVDDEIVENMKICVVSLSEMLDNLLDLSRLDAGVVKPDVNDFRLDDLLVKIMSSQAPGANLKGLALRLASCGLVVRTDPVLLQCIIENFVSNAVRYTRRGGILIGCRRAQGRHWVEVWDTGIGIPADKTNEIFEEYSQLGNPERNRDKGSGLGLAIVTRTAALLNLQIRVRSCVGKGSMFAVEVPLGEVVTPVASGAAAHRPLCIALVEDNAHVAAALAYALCDAGHEVVSAPTRSELLARLDYRVPDIVVSDYRLAGNETGFDVVDSFRSAFGVDLPVLIITGDTNPSVIARMASEGIDVLHKPLDIDVLRARIAELTAVR